MKKKLSQLGAMFIVSLILEALLYFLQGTTGFSSCMHWRMRIAYFFIGSISIWTFLVFMLWINNNISRIDNKRSQSKER